jgi:HEAT repeat protein
MIDDQDGSSSTLRLLVWQALKAYPTDTLTQFLVEEEPIVRTAAARELQLRGDEKILDDILALRIDPRSFVRETIAFTLGQYGTPLFPFVSRYEHVLRELLLKDASDEVRSAAAAAMGHLRLTHQLDALAKAAEDPSSVVRANVAFALGLIPRSGLAMSVIAHLASDADASVREFAAWAAEQ